MIDLSCKNTLKREILWIFIENPRGIGAHLHLWHSYLFCAARQCSLVGDHRYQRWLVWKWLGCVPWESTHIQSSRILCHTAEGWEGSKLTRRSGDMGPLRLVSCELHACNRCAFFICGTGKSLTFAQVFYSARQARINLRGSVRNSKLKIQHLYLRPWTYNDQQWCVVENSPHETL